MSDDDLRFGDVDSSGGGTGGTDIGDLFRQLFMGIVGLYILLKMVEVLFNIPIPLI